MAKVLLIKKNDGTQTTAPLANKPMLLEHNNRLKQSGKGWEIEEVDMTEEEIKNLPYINPDFKTSAEKDAALSEKDSKIAELEAKLAALNSGKSDADDTKAVNVIAKIDAAKTEAEVKEILGTDQRATVIAAANTKIASFKQ